MKSIITVGGALIFGSILTSIFSAAPFNPAIASMILFMLAGTERIAFLWTLTLGIFLETVSPLPPLVRVLSFLAVFLLLRIFIRAYVSRHTIFSALLSSAVATFIFEFLLLILSRVGGKFSAGWHATISGAYIHNLIINILSTAILTAGLFVFLRRVSPKVRGIRLERI